MSRKSDYAIDGQKLCHHKGRLISWLEATTWEEAKEIYPIYMEISPFGACNHRCTFCGVKSLRESNDLMEGKVLVSRLKEMGSLGVKSIMYAGEGEPLLHPNIVEIVSKTKEAGIDVAFTTNGVFLEKIFPVLGSISWIKVSINAGTNDTYAKIHKAKGGDFAKVLQNIKKAVLKKRKHSYKCTIGAQIVVLPDNHSEILELANSLWKAGAEYLVVKPYSPHPLEGKGVFSIKKLGYEEQGFLESLAWLKDYFSSKTFNLIVRENAFKNVLKEDRIYDRCFSTPFFWAYITSQGDVYSCSVFIGDERFKLGNIYEQSFQETWEGDKRRQNWEMMKIFDASVCRKGCRMDSCNIFLDSLRKNGLGILADCPREDIEHLNFI